MILGISSFAYGWAIGVEGNIPPRPMLETDLLKLSTDFGLRCIQIGDNLALHNLPEERLLNLKNLIEKQNIRLELGARMLTSENLRRYIDLAKLFHSPLLRFVVDGSNYEPNANIIISIIKELLPELERAQIILGIENHDRFKARELESIMKRLDHTQVGICLDCVNSMGAGEGLEHVVDILAPYTVNLHIKDFCVQRLPHKMGFTINGTPAGKGLIDIPFIMERLAPFNRCESAVLEQWVPFEHDIETVIAVEKEWAVESIQYLKRLPYFQTTNIQSIL
jgi:3-oxoisoapionate decarboxylase